jgi:hypothetical protein
VYEYDGGEIERQDDVTVAANGSLTREYPANSITLLVTPEAEEVPVPATTTLVADAILLHLPVIGLPGALNTAAATLRDATSGAPIPGQTITFTSGPAVLCTATTNADGKATCPSYPILAIVQILLNLGYTANYAGTPEHGPSTARGNLIRLGPLTL